MISRQRLMPVLAVLAALSILGSYFTLSSLNFSPIQSVSWLSAEQDLLPLAPIPHPATDPHPIIHLLHKAEAEFEELLRKETYDLAASAWAYRACRGHHPPPGWDKWHQYAVDNNVVFVEEFWDQIYHDLKPLWALDQAQMHTAIRSQNEIIHVRNGRATCNSDHFWAKIWTDLVDSVSYNLPDLDMAINIMDEPRLLIPWEEMNSHIQSEQKGRSIISPSTVTSKYSGVPEHDPHESLQEFGWNRQWPLFERTRLSCPKDSPSHNTALQTDFSMPPKLSTQFTLPHTRDDYVSNYSLSTSICHQPDLQGLHGFFIEPVSIKTSDKLFPFFGGSKLSVNSEILIPAAMYYNGGESFTSKKIDQPWAKKSDIFFWRGLASGGRNKEDNWKGFHRHRLVSMLNGTQALLMPNSSGFIDIQNLSLEMWQLEAWNQPALKRSEAIGTWLDTYTKAGFTGLACFPKEEGEGCSYTDYLFRPHPRVNLRDQHGHKYLIDVDGNSFSGRYRDFLLSGSVPIKATLFREWHDSRLVAWKHFVPFDDRFLDLYGIMEFFLGYGGKNGKRSRDELARRIAKEGQEWAGKVLRKEDMRVYVYRLLLEYARVMDEKRETLGWADDQLT